MDEQKNNPRLRGRRAVPSQYRRKRSVKKPAILFGMVALVCIAAVLLLWRPWERSSADDQNTLMPPADQVIHIVAGGDVSISDKTVAAGYTADGYDYQKVFQDVLPVLASGDITMLNFEGILSGSEYGTASKAAPPELLRDLANAGVDVLQTANSYSVFDGLRGLTSTLQGVRDAGMTPLGTYASSADFNNSGGYVIWEVGGIKVAMMAFTKGMDGMGLPTENCVNLLYEDYNSTYQKVDEEGITRVVRNAAAHDPDVMIALVHWGSKASTQSSKTQNKICTILKNEGVDAIIGTHPYNVQTMEFDADAGTFVAWSLGVFYGEEANYSVLLDLEITKDGTTGATKVTGFDFIPVYLETQADGSLRLLRIREAIAGYENRYLDRVSEETYNAMKTALARIESRIGAK